MVSEKRTFDLSILTSHRQELYGVATLWIITFHSYLCNVYFPTVIGNLITYGNMGCEVFLFLSGICLYFSYRGNEQYAPFIKRRLIRLYVPIMLICVWYWLYLLIKSGVSLGSFGTLVANFLTLSLWITGDSQIWFVSLLLVVYLLYPLVYRFMFCGKHTNIAAVLLLVLSVGLALLLKAVAPGFYSRTEVALTRLPVFLIGCWFGQAVYTRKLFPRWVIIPCAVTFCGVIGVLNADVLHGICRRYFYLFGGIALTFVLAWLFNRIAWHPLHAVFSFFGNMSLELYLWNIILIRLYRATPFYDTQHPSAVEYLLLLVLNILLAYISYRISKCVTSSVQRRLLKRNL